MARTFTKNLANYLYLPIGSTAALLNGAAGATLSGWIFPTSTDTGANSNRVFTAPIDALASGLILAYNSDGTIACGVRSQATDTLQSRSSTATGTLSTWTHVGAVFDFAGGAITPYVKDSASNAGAATFGSTTFVGGTPTARDGIGSGFIAAGAVAPSSTPPQFAGSIGELGLWNVALNANEMSILGRGVSPLKVRRANLVGYWNLNNGGSTEPDYSGHGGLGTIVGTVARAASPPVPPGFGADEPIAETQQVITGAYAPAAQPATSAYAAANVPPAVTGGYGAVAQPAGVAYGASSVAPATTGGYGAVAQPATVAYGATNTPPGTAAGYAPAAQPAGVAYAATNTPPATTAVYAPVAQPATAAYVAATTAGNVATYAPAAGPATPSYAALAVSTPVTTGYAPAARPAVVDYESAVINNPVSGGYAPAAQPATAAYGATANAPVIVDGTGYFTPYFPNYFTGYFPGSSAPTVIDPGPFVPGAGYFTGYFPSYFTQYFPGAGAVPPPDTTDPTYPGTGYFTGYFPSYFTQYFPGSGAVPVILPRTFLAALRRLLLQDSYLMNMLPGGWWHREIPRGTPEPAGLYFIPVSNNEDVGGPHFIQTGQLQIQVYSPVAATARVIADLATLSLNDKSLTWETGRLMELRASEPSSPGRSAAGYRATDVFGEIRTFNYMLSGRYNAPVTA